MFIFGGAAAIPPLNLCLQRVFKSPQEIAPRCWGSGACCMFMLQMAVNGSCFLKILHGPQWFYWTSIVRYCFFCDFFCFTPGLAKIGREVGWSFTPEVKPKAFPNNNFGSVWDHRVSKEHEWPFPSFLILHPEKESKGGGNIQSQLNQRFRHFQSVSFRVLGACPYQKNRIGASQQFPSRHWCAHYFDISPFAWDFIIDNGHTENRSDEGFSA